VARAHRTRLKVTDELGPHWVALDGEDFLERIELAGLLTLEFARNGR
jgi:hypothetical protein